MAVALRNERDRHRQGIHLAKPWLTALRRGHYAPGSFSRSEREADDGCGSTRTHFVDTFEGALAEAGAIVDSLDCGIIDRERIQGELVDSAREGDRTR